MGAQRALGRRTPKSWEFLDSSLVALVDRLARRLRGAHRVCRTVVLRLRFADFSRATRSHTLSEATAETATILVAARELLVAAEPLIRAQGITLIGVTLGNLENEGAIQLSLPLEPRPVQELDVALDDIRERFGTGAITRAVLVGRSEDVTVPLLPD
jgi:DNA polymerase-4